MGPKIINRLSKTSINETILDRNRIRGRVIWPKTAEARIAAGNDKSIFIYSQKCQIFDLPENRLFLHLIQKANEISKSFVSDGYLNLTWYSEINPEGKWLQKISFIAFITDKMLTLPVVSKISKMNVINPRFVSIAEKCRQSEYRELAIIANDYYEKYIRPLDYLDRELEGHILEPLNKDALFEIAVLFKIMEVAEKCGWVEIKTGLLGGKSKVVSVYKRNNVTMKIYTQTLPLDFKENSIYGPLMNSYNLSDRLRRPDIILEFENDSRLCRRFLIVEVKRSKNRAYLADGAYKLLGYLKDFEAVGEVADLYGFLVGWDGIEKTKYKKDSEIHLSVWDNLSDGLLNFLQDQV